MNSRVRIAVLSLLVLAGCAEKGPVLLSNVKYLAPEGAKAGASKVIAGVAPFRDLRGTSPSALGKRTIGDDIANDLVVQGSVADLVTAAFKDALAQRGLTVADAPAWDQKAETIAGSGFDLLIGGEIRTLWVDVASQPLKVQGKAEVSLRVSAAGVADRTVVKTLTMNSRQERTDVAFSFETVETLLSEALSSAIEQFLKDDEVRQKLR